MDRQELQKLVDGLGAADRRALSAMLKPKPRRKSKGKSQIEAIIATTRHIVALKGSLLMVRRVHFCGESVMATDFQAYLNLPMGGGVNGSIDFSDLREYKKGNIEEVDGLTAHLDTGAVMTLLEPDDIPNMPKIEVVAWAGELTPEDVEALVALAPIASSDNGRRPVMGAIYMELGDGAIGATTADGFKLAHRDISCGAGDDVAFLLPARYAKALQAIGGGGLFVEIGASGEHQWARFTAPNGTTLTVLGEPGRYPDYRQVVPSVSGTTWDGSIDAAWVASVTKGMPKVDGKRPWYSVQITVSGSLLKVEQETGQVWETECLGGEAAWACDWRYFDALVKAAGEDVHLYLQGAAFPVLMKARQWEGVLMPMTIEE